MLKNFISILNGFIFASQMVGHANGVHVEIFQNESFTDLIFEKHGSIKCNAPSELNTGEIGSIRTDACIIIYTGSQCNHQSFKILPPGITNLSTVDFEANGNTATGFSTFRSYQTCSSEDGGAKVNVDIYSRADITESWPIFPKEKVLASYQDICSCQNVPVSISETPISIDNHANYISVYEDNDCNGESKIVPGGYNEKSFKAEYFNFDTSEASDARRIRSIGPYLHPDHFPKHCIKFTANIFKFRILAPDVSKMDEYTSSVEIAPKTIFMNNGRATMSQEYSAIKAVGESVDVEIAPSLTNMGQVKMEDSFELKTEAGISFLAEKKFKTELKAGFEFNSSESWMEGTIQRKQLWGRYGWWWWQVDGSREFSVTQKIVVPPCTEYTMSAIVTTVENMPVPYKAYMKLTGMLGEIPMTSGQIKKYMHPELEYVKNWDEHTVVAIANGILKVEYGVSSSFAGYGVNIPGCVSQ